MSVARSNGTDVAAVVAAHLGWTAVLTNRQKQEVGRGETARVEGVRVGGGGGAIPVSRSGAGHPQLEVRAGDHT